MQCVTELPTTEYSNFVYFAITSSLEKREKERKEAIKLLVALRKNESISKDFFTNGILKVISNLEDIQIDAPHAPQFTATVIGELAVVGLDLSFLKEPLRTMNKAAKFYANVLNAIAAVKVFRMQKTKIKKQQSNTNSNLQLG